MFHVYVKSKSWWYIVTPLPKSLYCLIKVERPECRKNLVLRRSKKCVFLSSFSPSLHSGILVVTKISPAGGLSTKQLIINCTHVTNNIYYYLWVPAPLQQVIIRVHRYKYVQVRNVHLKIYINLKYCPYDLEISVHTNWQNSHSKGYCGHLKL